MIAKLKKQEKRDQGIIREKLERLSALASEFLEKKFSYDSLVDDWEEMERLKSILWKNLWQGNINPDDIDWCPETNEDFAKMILHYHRLLTEGFWNNFKQELKHIKATKWPTIIPDEFAGLENESLADLDAFIKIEIPDTSMTVRFIRNSDKIKFMRSGVDAIPALLNLLQGLPMDNLRFCKNTDCEKFIVQTSGKNRKYCHQLCQSVQYQRERRKNKPDEYNKYHREYYEIKKKRNNKSKIKII